MKTIQRNKIKFKIFEEKELKEKLGMTDEETQLVLEYQDKFPELLQENGEGFCIDSRKLHSNLVEYVKDNKNNEKIKGDKFTQWIKRRIDKYNFVENEDYISVHKNVNGRFTQQEIDKMSSQKKKLYF